MPEPALLGDQPDETSNTREAPIPLKRWSKEWLYEIRGSMFVILTTITMAVFSDIFIYAIVVPVVPFAFVQRMGVSPDDVQSKVSIALGIFSAGMIISSFIFGYIADKIKHRQFIMMAGLLVVIGSTLMLCLAKSLAVYFVGRFLQGVSGSMVWTVGLAIVADSGDDENMAFYMSFPGIGTSMGMFLGPFIGGVVYDKAGYYPVFYICFGILVFDIFLRLFMLENSQLNSWRHKRALELSERDIASLSPELVTYMNRYINLVDNTAQYKIKERELQKIHGTYYTIFGKRFRLPVFLELLKDLRVANSMFLGILIAWMMTFFDSTAPLHLEEIFGFNSAQVGYVFLALAVPSIFEPLVGKLCDKYGSRYFIAVGFLLMTPVLILFRLPSKNSTGHIVLFVVLVTLLGFLLMGVLSPAMAEMSKAVTQIEARHPGIYGKSKGFGQAYGLFNVGYSIGSLIGPFHSGETRKHAGWNTMVLSLGIITFGTAVIALLCTEGFLFQKKAKKEEQITEV